MATELEQVDLVVEAGFVVPVEPHAVVLEDHAVVVRDGVIVAVLPTAQARERYAAGETVSRPHAALIPGLVNAHTHNPMTLMRGVADDLPLKVWLQQHIWPIEGAVMGPGFVEDGVTLAIAELLRGGVTCVNENYFFPDVQAATYRKYGFRARIGLPVIDFPTAWAASDDEYFDKAGAVHDQWRGDPLIAMAFAPHAPYTVNDANFGRVRMLADQLDIPVHLHLHETAQEIEQSITEHAMQFGTERRDQQQILEYRDGFFRAALLVQPVSESAQRFGVVAAQPAILEQRHRGTLLELLDDRFLALHRLPHERGRRVAREVVHDDHLVAALRVVPGEDRVEAGADGVGLVARRHDDRDEREGWGDVFVVVLTVHRPLSAVCRPPHDAPEAHGEAADGEGIAQPRPKQDRYEDDHHGRTSTGLGAGSAASRSFRMSGSPTSDGRRMLTQNSRNAALNAAAPAIPSALMK